jgi:hypothetical protein
MIANIEGRKDDQLELGEVKMTEGRWDQTLVSLYDVPISLSAARGVAIDLRWGAKVMEAQIKSYPQELPTESKARGC